MAILRAVEEAKRLRELGDDNKYWRQIPFVFELRVKNDAFVYPLPIAPSRYSVSTPFTLRETMTLFGGVVLEENGIVVRRIIIDGTMGLSPKAVVGASFPIIQNPAPSFRPRGKFNPTLMSGQRHLQFLEDRIFKTYGDLKKNPETSATTRLHFHSLKDNDSYLVAPIVFDVMRAIPRTTFSTYHIELLAVRAVDAVKLTPSPDKSWADQVQNAYDTIRSAYSMVVGAIKDINRFVRDVERTINGISSTIVGIIDIGDAVADFIDGVADSIAAPFNLVTNAIEAIEDTVSRIIDSGIEAGPHIVAAFNRAKDALTMFSLHPRAFDPTVSELVRRGRTVLATASRFTNDSVSVSRTELESASQDTSALTADQYARMPILSGDLDRTKAQNFDTSARGAIVGFRSYKVQRGDTLHTIASKELGSVMRWQEIAYANRLSAPYISDAGLPNTVKPGDRILLPTDEKQQTQEQPSSSGIIGVKLSDKLDERLYGKDLAFVRDADGLYDIPIDYTNGATDGKIVRGVACVSQGLELRVMIERGHFPLYPNVGIQSIAGIRPDIEQDIIEIRVAETLLGDSRVTSVPSVGVNASEEDVREIEADVVLIGNDQAVAIESSVTTR